MENLVYTKEEIVENRTKVLSNIDNYEKTVECMREADVNNKKCCCILGVLCDIFDNTCWSKIRNNHYFLGKYRFIPPDVVVEYYGLYYKQVSELIRFNDRQDMTLKQLAETLCSMPITV